ncbi:hypothetical protein AAY86_02750 [Pseudomonas amygdali pv. tabaci str. ATCC 11528]|uniref:Type 1 fimbrial protein n=2 Tax=Pseudomonas syringae group genomosp. 2 TaxID=251698 RepID=A0AAX1VLJ1_PSEAJ|nr:MULTISPECIES: hypothetical protein [Pseudomonas syringae group]KEZ29175.1 hypothetical protein A3SK_0101110 [Pseudomonas amygdali pv. tabaci str. 6605]KEZ64070.1 hypothetical protein C1E_0228510 [Pseudomonas amygdali pv. tabaci str. ATCC 11528]KIY17232.1 hypothetical protein RD00_20070 [Pseudomonas amygdali pv. tabaci]KKY55051.1 hypothetical protein AAY86_02750 [Pseudomonas amygdali pv. tabaci str. ATCC 11528]KPY81353.1 Uncharacterized protein ALO60_04871 [Pseudomonas amygdali pv. tabaci]
MNSKKSTWKFMLRCLFLRQGLGAVMVSIPLLAAPAFSWAKDGALTLHGSIVNSSCVISDINVNAPVAHARILQVAPGINMQVSTEHNACGDQAVPFVAQYQVLPVAETDGEALQARAGVITLSYQ